MRPMHCFGSAVITCGLAFSATAQAPIIEPSCGETCDAPARRGSWSAGADALLIVPRFESNPAYFVNRRSVTPGGPAPSNSQTVEEFRYDLDFSPRVWISYTSPSGLGGRLRWFHLDQAANSREVVNPVIPLGSNTVYQSVSSVSPLLAIASQTTLPGVNSIQVQGQGIANDRLTFTSDIQLDMCDIEATFSDLHSGCWGFELFGGVRLARIEQNYEATSQGTIPQSLVSRQTFEGAGPTFGLEGNRRLGSSCFSVYGLGRISLLFGNDEHESSGLNIGLVPNFTYAFHDDRSSRDRIMPVIDLEMGVEGAKPVGRMEAFVRGGVFSQLIPLGSGANGNGNAGLIGLSLGTGVRY